jgi:Family of unknown function (DUF6052)
LSQTYQVTTLTDEDGELLRHAYADLMALSTCPVPSVRAAARAALAHVAQALNGQGLAFELYSKHWLD